MEKYLSSEVIEKQEHLSNKILDNVLDVKNNKYKFTQSIQQIKTNRPIASFVELMDWVEKNFAIEVLKDNNLQKFIHNRIMIDGQFLKFCQENKISVKCLFKESIVSWNSSFNYEKFHAQGIFHIKYKDVDFIHAALFHKGNQNEDEICYFIIIANNNYEKYLELRNSFDEWVAIRDRSNLHIRVVGGDDIPYDKESHWSDLFLPELIKKDIKKLVENFLSSKDFYIEKKIPWKRGMILYGKPGNGKTSIIRTIISEYNFKPVTVAPGADINDVRDAFLYAEEQSPSLLYFEDLDSLIENGLDVSTFLNLLDGISSRNGILIIATANNVSKLKSNIIQRPSRFDRKFEIPLPNEEMTYIYLNKWFNNSINPKKIKELSKISVSYGFSYAYLKELYISSMFEAISNNRKIPTEKDIDNILKRLIKEKNVLSDSNAINTDKYFK